MLHLKGKQKIIHPPPQLNMFVYHLLLICHGNHLRPSRSNFGMSILRGLKQAVDIEYVIPVCHPAGEGE